MVAATENSCQLGGLCLGFAGCVQLGALAAGESATRAVIAEALRCPARLPAVDFGLGIELAGQ